MTPSQLARWRTASARIAPLSRRASDGQASGVSVGAAGRPYSAPPAQGHRTTPGKSHQRTEKRPRREMTEAVFSGMRRGEADTGIQTRKG